MNVLLEAALNGEKRILGYQKGTLAEIFATVTIVLEMQKKT